MKQLAAKDGFTLIEVVISLFVVSIFLAIVLQTMYVSSIRQMETINQSAALDVAQSNLNKFMTPATIIQNSNRYFDAYDPLDGYDPSDDFDPIGAYDPFLQHPPFYCKPGTSFSTSHVTPPNFDKQPDTNTRVNPAAKGVEILRGSTKVSLEKNAAIPDTLINPLQSVIVRMPHGCASNEAISFPQAGNINATLLEVISSVTYGAPHERKNVEVVRYVKL